MEQTGFAALIGIDWGDREHHVVVWDVEHGTRQECSIEQTPEALHGWVASLAQRIAGRPLATGRTAAESPNNRRHGTMAVPVG